MFRKTIIDASNADSIRRTEEKDIGALATVLVSSEDADHPIDYAFDANEGRGATRWIAGEPGVQTVILSFDVPQAIRKVRLAIEEPDTTRTQEMDLSLSDDGGRTYRHVLRQEYNFSPPGTTMEREEWTFVADCVTQLRLRIKPDKSERPCRATLTTFAVS
ncbi:MAG TPA: hypothetical protein VFQ62_12845 [Methylomirabilota bacterium]|nr:hypothetical protein [Methylomirabilota bacterium]